MCFQEPQGAEPSGFAASGALLQKGSKTQSLPLTIDAVVHNVAPL